MPLDLWLAFVVASTVLCIIPGPTVLLVVSYALSQGRKVAVASAGGVALGDLVAMTASLVGLGALVLASATLFTVLKWIGAAYLVYLGVKLFMSAAEAAPGAVGAPRGTRPAEIFAHAAAVTALNPKSIAFFIAFVPQFMRPEAPLLPQFIILIATFVAVGFLNALLYALLADRMRVAIARPSVLRVLTRLGGATLVAMGVATAALRRA
ncbi:lysine transporter LysE [Thalassobacter stenotrophicus]|uniref:LysE family translocator n=1 Tax=Thalassobacter TaxID=266808 RepID=UPI00051DE661|nr:MULTISPECIES: LysE family translocator [Thalassobacter]KGK79295.1 lysine transporter LysE [Thalassobacter stenotrophicus]KGL00492.1 lysine transporter LysE [Thalassobacter sp. 16PALIMAR09]